MTTFVGGQAYQRMRYLFYDWGGNSPLVGTVNATNWSAFFQSRNVSFEAGCYFFHADADDGARILIDLNGDNWSSSPSKSICLTAGVHPMDVYYRQYGGDSRLRFWWRGPGGFPSTTKNPDQWFTQYYFGKDLWGAPPLELNEGGGYLNKQFGNDGPGYGMPTDNFSVNFERTVRFTCGTYRFHLDTDDGARVKVDETIVSGLDQWYDGVHAGLTGDAFIADGSHKVTVMYYENSGAAGVSLWWEQIAKCSPGAFNTTNPAYNTLFNRLDSVQLSWTPSSIADYYTVHIWGGPGINWYSPVLNTPSWNTGVIPGGGYYWQVKASNSTGITWSDLGNFYIKFGSPTNLKAVPISQTQVNLSWDPSVDAPNNIGYYLVYRNGVALGASIGANAISFSDAGLSCGSNYAYTVRAMYGQSASDPSNLVNVSTGTCIPATPGNLRAASVSLHTVSLSWDNVTNESGYHIYRWGYVGGKWGFNLLASVGVDITSYDDNNLASGTDYYYEIAAFNSNGDSTITYWIKSTTLGQYRVYLPIPTKLSPITTYAISGKVVNASGVGISGVSVADNAGHVISTTDLGQYTLSNLAGGINTIAPSKTGYSFLPVTRTVTLATNVTAIDFTGTPVSWTLSFASPKTAMAALTVYNGKLYATGWDGQSNARLYVYDGITWTDTHFESVVSTTINLIEALQVFNGRMYIGTRVTVSGTTYVRIYYFDGTSFTTDFSATGVSGYSGIEDITVHNGILYAANGSTIGEVYQRNSDANWISLGKVEPGSPARALIAYNGSLYAGTGAGGHARVWRWTGLSWTLVKDLTTDFSLNQNGVWSFAIFNNKLFVGTAGPGIPGPVAVYDGANWAISTSAPGCSSVRVRLINSALWAGTCNGNAYNYNGIAWASMNSTGEAGIFDLAEYNGYIYATTVSRGRVYRASLGTP